MPPPWDFRSRKGLWIGSCQSPAKMSGGLNKIDYSRIIDLVSQNSPSKCGLYQIMVCTLLELFVYDIVHPKAVLSFMPSSKKDEYYCQQLLMHKQSLCKSGIIWCHVIQIKNKHEFHAHGFTSLFLSPEILHDFCHNKVLPCNAANMDS